MKKQKIKYGKDPKAKILRKIIIMKDGNKQEIEEEVPLEEVEEIKPEEEPESKVREKKIIIKDDKKQEVLEACAEYGIRDCKNAEDYDQLLRGVGQDAVDNAWLPNDEEGMVLS